MCTWLVTGWRGTFETRFSQCNKTENTKGLELGAQLSGRGLVVYAQSPGFPPQHCKKNNNNNKIQRLGEAEKAGSS
jgi:hypothetical protein